MAGDWIKMRTDLYRDPKVIAIAEMLMDPDGDLACYVNQINQRDMSVTRNVMRNVTVGALVTVWGVTRHQGKRDGDDAILSGVSTWVVDEMVDLPGFGAALASVGWMIEEDGKLRFPKFFAVHNADPADEMRDKNRERQQRYRDKKRNVSVTSFRNAREEKSREEKSNTHTHTASGFEEAWQRWCDWRESQTGRPMDPIQAEAILLELNRRGPEKAAADIDFSIRKDAKSILDSSNDFEKRSKSTTKKTELRI